MSDDNMSSDVPTKIGEPPEIDEEIDDFAESAFDALMMDGEGKSSSEQPEAVEVAEDAESATTATGEYEDVELDDVIMVSDVPPEELSAASAPPSAPPASMRPESAPPAPTEGPNTGEIQVARLRSESLGSRRSWPSRPGACPAVSSSTFAKR